VAAKGARRGWAAVLLLALAAAALSVVPPVLLIFVPFGFLLVSLALKRPLLAVAGALLGASAFIGQPDGGLWFAERGWVLVLASWFLLLTIAQVGPSFLPRALSALGLTALSTGAVIALRPGGWHRLDSSLGMQFRQGGTDVAGFWRQAGLDRFASDIASAATRAAEMQALLYPALLGLGSLAALAVAWWGYRRLLDAGAQPLGRLRDFRFSDELVWLVIGGLVLWLVPLGPLASRAGANLLVFMGALYALRGFGVLAAVAGTPGPLVAVAGALVFLLLYPFVMGAAVILGLSDTWLDFRTRRRQAGGLF
jgi:Predicted membrane protein (DUF2232)